jgi:hypothetical protein
VGKFDGYNIQWGHGATVTATVASRHQWSARSWHVTGGGAVFRLLGPWNEQGRDGNGTATGRQRFAAQTTGSELSNWALSVQT